MGTYLTQFAAVSVKDPTIGAVGNGTTNDTTAIQAALNVGAGNVVYFPPGTYLVTSQLTVTPGTTIAGAGAGKSIIDGKAVTGGGNAVLKCTGTTVSLPSIASAINYGAGTITFSSSVASSLAHGDWVRIYDSTTNSMNNNGNEDGFTCMVKAIDGSTLYPAALNLRTLPAARTGGPNSNVLSKKLDKRGLIVRDIAVRGAGYGLGPNSGAASGSCVYTLDIANVQIVGCNLEAGGTAGLRLEQSANCHVRGCAIGTHTGDYNNAAHYGIDVRGSAYTHVISCDLEGQRSSFDASNRFGPAHNVVLMGNNIGGPGTDIFSQPTTATTLAFGCHDGNFNLTFMSNIVQGRVSLDGFGIDLLYNTIVNGDAQNLALIEIGDSAGPPLDMRIIGNKGYCRKTSSGGVFVGLDENDWDHDNGAIGSLVISDNDIYILANSSSPIINLIDSTAKTPNTGVVHIMNNRVGHKEGATSQPFCNIAITNGEECVVTGNILQDNMTLGTVGTFGRRVLSPNVINGHVVMTSLPTSTPGGSGRLWSNGGVLQIT